MTMLPKLCQCLRHAAAALILIINITGTLCAEGGPEIPRILDRADEAFYYREYDNCERYLKEALALNPGEALIYIRIGQLNYARGEYQKARKAFETAGTLHAKPDEKRFLETALGKILTNSKVLEKIEKTPETPENVDTLLKLHIMAAESMSRGKAYMSLISPHLEYILNQRPEEAGVLKYLADGYYLSSHMRMAAVFYEKLKLILPENYKLFKKLGDTYAAIRDVDRSRKNYDKALIEGEIFYAQVKEEETLRLWKKESTEIKKLIAALPPDIEAISDMIEKEDYENAGGALRKRLALNPHDVVALTLLGRVYDALDDDDGARRIYLKARELDDAYPGVNFYLGQFYLMNDKNYAGALSELELFRENLSTAIGRIDSEEERNKQIENMVLATRYMAYIYSDIMREYQRGIEELKRAARWDGDNAEIYYSLGVVYWQAKDRSNAYRNLKRVIALEKDSKLAKDAEEAIEYIQTHTEDGYRFSGPYEYE